MKTFGEELVNFFVIKDRYEIIYPCIGPLISQEGYETDFHSIVAEMNKRVKKVGIGISEDIKIREKDYDKVIVANIFEYKFRGVLFLPEITRWTSYKEGDELNTIKHFLNNVEKGVYYYMMSKSLFSYILREEYKKK